MVNSPVTYVFDQRLKVMLFHETTIRRMANKYNNILKFITGIALSLGDRITNIQRVTNQPDFK